MNAAFEVIDPVTGHVWRVFEDGRIEGFGDGKIIDNRIPNLLAAAVAAVRQTCKS